MIFFLISGVSLNTKEDEHIFQPKSNYKYVVHKCIISNFVIR